MLGLAVLAVLPIDGTEVDQEYPVIIDAGPDQTTRSPSQVQLDGSASTLSPLIYLTGDGNGPLEDRLMEYDSRTGVRSRTMRNSLNSQFGWPGDMVRVEGRLIAGHASSGRLLLVERNSSSFRYLSEPITKGLLSAMAFDPIGDRLLAADLIEQKLYAIDLDSMESEIIRSFAPLKEVRGLAWSNERQGPIAYDQETRGLYFLDLSSDTLGKLVSVQVPDDAICDEIEMFQNRLFGTIGRKGGDLAGVQLCEIDQRSGELTPLGPVMGDTVGHMLVMLSAPERTRWSLLSGPDNADISTPESLQSEVILTEPGEYVFELSTQRSDPLSDRVTVTLSKGEDR